LLQELWPEIEVPLQEYRAPLSVRFLIHIQTPDWEIHQGKAIGSSDLFDTTKEFSQVKLMQRILNQNATIIQTVADIWIMIKFKT
jgi:hypothetical protein